MKIKNDDVTPVGDIIGQMLEPRPLPLGRSEFEEWSDRLIAGACIPCEPGQEEELIAAQKYAVANMVMHLGPTESHKPDAHFIHSLRKVASNQICHSVIQEFLAEKAAKAEEQKADLKLVPKEVEASDIS